MKQNPQPQTNPPGFPFFKESHLGESVKLTSLTDLQSKLRHLGAVSP